MALEIKNIAKVQSVEGSKTNFWKKEISILSNGFSEKSKEQFYSSLSTLVSSGLDLFRALEIVSEETDNKFSKEIFEGLLKLIQKGKSLSEAMTENPKGVFSNYEVASVKIGEEVGKLYLVLNQLKDYFEASIKRKRMLVNALTYPVLVIFIAFGAVFFMMVFVVPMFQDVFKRFNGELPWITQKVINFSQLVTEYKLWLVSMIVGSVFLIRFLMSRFVIRLFVSKILIRTPFIGSFIVKNQLTKITGMLSMMLGSGIHLVRALELVSGAIEFLPYKQDLLKVKKEIEEGKDMYQSLTNKVLYPSKFRSLVKIGEEVNKLDYFFHKMEKDYNQELEQSTAILGAVLEPILLVFLGGVIGVILISMYLPLFELSSQW